MRHTSRLAVSAIAMAMAMAVPGAAAAADAAPAAGRVAVGQAKKATTKAPAVRPVAAPQSMIAALRSRRGPVPRGRVPKLVPDGSSTVTTAGEPFWSFGVTEQQSGLNCSIIDNPYYEPQVTSQAGYGGTADVPKVGERFNIVLLYSHPGYACSDGFLADLYTELHLPDGAQVAVDATHGIGCYTTTRADPDTWVDVTTKTWSTPNGLKGSWCKTNGGVGKYGGLNLGLRMMVTGTMFQIVIPAIATKELKGAANTPVAEFWGVTETVVATQSIGLPYVWANVLGYQAPSVGYPTPSATELTPTSAKLTGYVYNHYTAGTARIEFGPTTAYGATSDPATIDPGFDANMMWATWSGLQPAKTYHWRVKFTNASGQVTYGPDQAFTTPGASVVGKVGTGLSLTSYGARANNLHVMTVDGNYAFTDTSGGKVLPGAGCRAVQANSAICDGPGITGITVDGGSYNDIITIESGMPIRTTLKGGSGNDTLTGWNEPDVLDGGAGADTLNGGGGIDTASYANRQATQPVSLSLDGVANDGGTADVSGAAKDDIKADVENLTGGAGADTLTGNTAANVLNGGKGADTLRGLEGSDRLLTQDEIIDAVIDCGAGTGDRATVDLAPVDPAATGCESVTKL